MTDNLKYITTRSFKNNRIKRAPFLVILNGIVTKLNKE